LCRKKKCNRGISLPTVGTMELVVILVAVILFGPKRIPEIARQIGRAMNELRRAGDELMKELTLEEGRASGDRARHRVQKPLKESAPPEPKPLTSTQIRSAAESLGISTEGKSDDKLRSEILERIYSAQIEHSDPELGHAG